MPADRPLCTLLSQLLVAFTIEFDNEAEHRIPHRTTVGPATGSPRPASLADLAGDVGELPALRPARRRAAARGTGPGRDHQPGRGEALGVRHGRAGHEGRHRAARAGRYGRRAGLAATRCGDRAALAGPVRLRPAGRARHRASVPLWTHSVIHSGPSGVPAGGGTRNVRGSGSDAPGPGLARCPPRSAPTAPTSRRCWPGFCSP